MKDDYSLADKVLHYVALQSKLNTQMFFNIERSIYARAATDSAFGKHVFVSGLARSGTTALMRAIYGSNQFASLTYRDMPFVLSPNLWGQITDRFSRSTQLQERAHGDGIMVDYNSPEAFDEVFWIVFSSDDYIKEYGLIPHNPGKEILDLFADYVGLILHRRKKSRYLSKNNNNILRIPALRSIFPNAIILIPIRDPISHSKSLLTQHQRFCKANKFTERYMNWLGHHEFGVTHKPFVFNEKSEMSRDVDTDDLVYWVDLWFNCYSYLSRLLFNEAGVYFVPYESLCADQRVWNRITESIGIDENNKGGFRRIKVELDSVPSSCPIMQRANELYHEIKMHSLKELGIDSNSKCVSG